MFIAVNEVSKGRNESALPKISVEFQSGRATLALAETAQRPSVLGLIASGRMRPDTGHVTIDYAQDAHSLRARVALVDAPDVNDPSPEVSVYTVVAEELMFAGLPAGPRATRRALGPLGVEQWRSWTIGTVPPIVRIRLLTELAVMREDVEGIVLTAPDRHGGDPAAWWDRANELASRGYAVLVIAGVASASALGMSAGAGDVVQAAPAAAPPPSRRHLLTVSEEPEVSP
ncbi:MULTISPECIES: hypothetical protein [unclassified Salinibacterium]|uniref:hypothetical protein n=1 Tax=unclassified Salinibacterium TaxID=2632331 RepID=UPI00164F6272|nr:MULTISPECIES: hypothetical protein [unclassified Salinibacterium]